MKRACITDITGQDGVRCETLDGGNSDVVDAFWDYFQQFSGVMGYISPGETGRRWLDFLADEDYLDLSMVMGSEARALAYHAYCRVGNHARFLHACWLHKAVDDSAGRAFVGRANRYLFLHDILRLKEAVYAIYDFGGWYAETDNKQMLGVYKFKEGFGGVVVPTFTCNLGCTLKGPLAL
ncbi:MAG: hypothetical protein ABSB95_16325 [Dissulfurispiraceae bacterium]